MNIIGKSYSPKLSLAITLPKKFIPPTAAKSLTRNEWFVKVLVKRWCEWYSWVIEY